MEKSSSSNILQRYIYTNLMTEFIGANLKYFAVSSHVGYEPTSSQLIMEDLLSTALEQDKEYERQLNIAKESTHVTLTPWLRRTGWTLRFLGQNMLDLSGMTKKPTAGEEGLVEVWNSVERTVKRSFEGVKDCDARGWHLILFWLASSQGDTEASQPFRQHFNDNTISRYVSYWQRFICFCLRAVESSDECGVEFRPMQKNMLLEVRSKVELDNVMEEVLDADVTA